MKSYFNVHNHDYDQAENQEFYYELLDYIHKIKSNNKLRILDVGCGGGSFIETAIRYGMHADFVGIDIAENMIEIARNKLLERDNVELYVMDIFSIRKEISTKFDIIYVHEVLHHLIARTQGGSKRLLRTAIQELIDMLSSGGILLIDEVFFTSYIIPSISSKVIFYGLKLLNSLRLDMKKVIPNLHLGLEANFISNDNELIYMLKKYTEDVIMLRKESSPIPSIYRLFLVKDFGFMRCMARKN